MSRRASSGRTICCSTARKLGGILCELAVDADGQSTLVIGVGINVLLTADDRAHIGQPAAALADVLPARMLAGEREAWIAALATTLCSRSCAASRQRALPRRQRCNALLQARGAMVDIIDDGRTTASGRILEVDAAGRLVLETASGPRSIQLGDVSVRHTLESGDWADDLLLDVGNTALKWAQSEGDRRATRRWNCIGGAPMAWNSASRRRGRRWLGTTPRWAAALAAADVREERSSAPHGPTVDRSAGLRRKTATTALLCCKTGIARLGSSAPIAGTGMLGACERRPGQSLVLVAAGTATTIHCVEWSGGESAFIGGCIAPGTQMMLESLAQRTGGLPHARGDWVDFPDNTDDAIATGVTDAQAGLALRVVERARRRFGSAPQVIVSGGDADALVSGCPSAAWPSAIEHNLVLGGLALRARTTDHGSHR